MRVSEGERVAIRRRNRNPDQQPLGPEDDPYLAYLIWREEQDAAQVTSEAAPDPILEPARRWWVRRLAVWRRGATDDSDR
jgi:hypothetical protein